MCCSHHCVLFAPNMMILDPLSKLRFCACPNGCYELLTQLFLTSSAPSSLTDNTLALLVLWNLSRLVRRCLTNMVRAVLSSVWATSLIAPHTFASATVFHKPEELDRICFTTIFRAVRMCNFFFHQLVCVCAVVKTVCQKDPRSSLCTRKTSSSWRWHQNVGVLPTCMHLKNVSTLPFFQLQLQPATSVRLQTKTNPPPGSSPITIGVHKCRSRASTLTADASLNSSREQKELSFCWVERWLAAKICNCPSAHLRVPPILMCCSATLNSCKLARSPCVVPLLKAASLPPTFVRTLTCCIGSLSVGLGRRQGRSFTTR